MAALLFVPAAVTAQELGVQAVAEEAISVAPRGGCRLAGTWIGSSPPFLPELGDQPLIFAETITPIDPACRRFTTVLSPVNAELTFSGLFPETVTASDLFGVVTRSGRDWYEIEAVTYFAGAPAGGAPVRGQVVYFWTYSGTVSCLDADCTEKLQEGMLRLYSSIDDPDRSFPPLGIDGISDADLDDDGFPDAGAAPLFEAPFPLASRRWAN